MTSRFKALDARQPASKPVPVQAMQEIDKSQRQGLAKAREGKKPIQGYFSPELSRELRMMSVAEGTTVQALLGEAIDLLLTARGKNRYSER